jgi:hypothetical protein
MLQTSQDSWTLLVCQGPYQVKELPFCAWIEGFFLKFRALLLSICREFFLVLF